MNRQTFLQLIRQPASITPEDIRELEAFVEQYPFCQAAHVLIAKYYADNGHMLAGLKVKKAALYVADRSRLKDLIELTDKENAESLKKTASFIPQEIKQETPLQEIKKTPETVSEKEKERERERERKKETETESEKKEPVVEVQNVGVVNEVVKEAEKEKNPEVSETDNNKLLEELQQSLIALRESRKKAFIQKEKQLEEHISKDTVSTEYSTPDVEHSEIKEAEKETAIEAVTEQETETTGPEVLEKESVEEQNETVAEQEILPENEAVSFAEEDLTGIKTGDQILQVDSLNHYYPDNERGPLPIPATFEYKSVEDSQVNLLSNYFEFLNQKRQVFKKNKKKEEEIIERLSKEEPVMPKMNARNLPEETEDLATKSSTLQKGPVSENFARILVLQGKTDKAIEIYKELSLKFPKKKTYFEAQIEKLKTKL